MFTFNFDSSSVLGVALIDLGRLVVDLGHGVEMQGEVVKQDGALSGFAQVVGQVCRGLR